MQEKNIKKILFIAILILLACGIYIAYLDNGPRKQKSIEVNLV